ncbi:MAG: hypothetical protein AAF823_06900 [Planctomycetota bacterium]
MPVLGQTIQWNGIVTWVVVIVVVAVLLSVVLVWIRRSIVADDPPMTSGIAFGPAELDAMLERGELTPDEHQRAREKMLAKMVGTQAPPPTDETPPPPALPADAAPLDGPEHPDAPPPADPPDKPVS